MTQKRDTVLLRLTSLPLPFPTPRPPPALSTIMFEPTLPSIRRLLISAVEKKKKKKARTAPESLFLLGIDPNNQLN